MKHILIVLLGLVIPCANVARAQKPNQYSAKLKFYNLPKNKIWRIAHFAGCFFVLGVQ